MNIALFDIIGILFFFSVAFFIYKKAWFFSFYSFTKFIIVFAASFAAGLAIAPRISNFLPLTSLQFSLLIQGLLFIILWKLISFKRIFFFLTDRIIPVNRFFFMHGVDKVLNIFPSLVVAFFFTFFIFTTLVAASTKHPDLQAAIESSSVVKPLAYKIYSASLDPGNNTLFEGVAFNLAPSTSFSNTDTTEAPLVYEYQPGSKSFTPYVAPAPQRGSNRPTQTLNPTINAIPTQPPVQTVTLPANTPTPLPSTPTPQSLFHIFERPTSAPVPAAQEPTQAPITSNQSPIAPIAQIIQPPPVNINSVEQDIFRLTNEQRVKNSLPPFVWDEKLASIARAHSQDMANRNFFNHTSPDGGTIFGRMLQAGIQTSLGGENIAGGPTADVIVSQWMNSPGHRANILNPLYKRLGVGVATNSQYGLLATQDFTN